MPTRNCETCTTQRTGLERTRREKQHGGRNITSPIRSRVFGLAVSYPHPQRCNFNEDFERERERERKKRGGKKRKNKKKEKYTSVERRARETDSAASSVITINCSPRDNYRYPWNGRRGDMPRVRVSLRFCSPTVRFFRPSPPSLPPSLAQMASAEYTIEHDTRRLLLSLSLYLGSSVSLNEFIN